MPQTLLVTDQEANPKLLMLYRLLLSAYMPQAGFPSKVNLFFFFTYSALEHEINHETIVNLNTNAVVYFITPKAGKRELNTVDSRDYSSKSEQSVDDIMTGRQTDRQTVMIQ